MTKQMSFFNEQPGPKSHAQRCKKFGDYEVFTAKFKPKKTTDDCYTPPAVYAAVLDWIRARVDLTGRQILRPFYPGGDFEHAEYPPGCVVIDNPPFSIMRRILTFYVSRKIDFFLFGQGTTLLQRGLDSLTYIIMHATIIYENGARVPTGFVSNLFPGRRLILSGTLTDAIETAQKSQKGAVPPSIDLPPEVVTAARLRACVTPGEDLEISDDETGPMIASFGGRRLYGVGMFVTPMVVERLRAERLRAERLRAERLRAERLRAERVFLIPTPEEADQMRSLVERAKTDRLRAEALRRAALMPELRRDQLRGLAEIDDLF